MRPDADARRACVAEMQGLYGAFSFPERLLQKIWQRGDFDSIRARTADGRPVRVLHPGKWNLLGGPDFLGARLRFDAAPEVTGDIEVHLHAADWEAHGHAADRAYDRVVLHVVLFPPEEGRRTIGADGGVIPVLALLPLLFHDLEEYAAEDAVENLAGRALARLPEELGALPAAEVAALLHRHAGARWRQKVHFARLRRQRLGWAAACHHTALEILGYRFNRAPMLRLAGRWPLPEWSAGRVGADEAFAAEAGGWSLQGVRPANHPWVRLRQYSEWTRARPDWPSDLARLGAEMPDAPAGVSTRDFRRRHRLAAWREQLADRGCAHVLGGTRLESMVGDGFLPLLAAQTGRELFGWWYHWPIGDLPPPVSANLRRLGIFDGRNQPACHGGGQGLLGWLIEREGRP